MVDLHPNLCLTEDSDLKATIIALARCHIPGWDENAKSKTWPVYVKHAGEDGGVDNVLNAQRLDVYFKSSGLKVFGIVVDADDDLESVWARIRRFAAAKFTSVPDQMPPGGLILTDNEDKHFGAWVMPDNQSPGMLETFLAALIFNQDDALWKFAGKSIVEAKTHGGNWRECHKLKAQIHTWLAWKDPPGIRIGSAINQRLLNPNAKIAVQVMDWFKRLYKLN